MQLLFGASPSFSSPNDGQKKKKKEVFNSTSYIARVMRDGSCHLPKCACEKVDGLHGFTVLFEKAETAKLSSQCLPAIHLRLAPGIYD
jgi:hypothetical protein